MHTLFQCRKVHGESCTDVHTYWSTPSLRSYWKKMNNRLRRFLRGLLNVSVTCIGLSILEGTVPSAPLGPNQETPCRDSNRETNRWEQCQCGNINNGDRSTRGGSAEYRGADLGSRQTRERAMVGNPPSEAPGVEAGGETPHSARWPWDVLWSHLKRSRTLESRREAPSSRDPFPHPLRTQLNITFAAKEKCLHGRAPRPQNRSWSMDSELGENKLVISPKKKKSRVGQKVHLGFNIGQYGKLKLFGQPNMYCSFPFWQWMLLYSTAQFPAVSVSWNV